MTELFVLLLIITGVAYVVSPMFRSRPEGSLRLAGEASESLHDLLYQKRVITGIINDLHFDHQTGKLSDADHEELTKEQQRSLARFEERLDQLQSSGKDDIAIKLEREIGQVRSKLAAPKGLFCSHCGQAMPRDAKFCSQCGASLNQK